MQVVHRVVVGLLLIVGWFLPIRELGYICWIAAIFYALYVAEWFLPPDDNSGGGR